MELPRYALVRLERACELVLANPTPENIEEFDEAFEVVARFEREAPKTSLAELEDPLTFVTGSQWDQRRKEIMWQKAEEESTV